jgi:hypothetical protein
MIPTVTPTATGGLPAIHFRECVLADDGTPLDGDIPENWELVDSRPAELLEIGHGLLLITSADDLAFVQETLLPGWEEGNDIVIRAIYAPEVQEKELRMGDILTVVVEGAVSICYEVLITQGDIPHLLEKQGEMCLALRLDFSPVAGMADVSGNE